MRILVFASILLAMACAVRGEDPALNKVSQEAAFSEAQRRGDHVETTGETSAGPEALIGDAMSLPEDDSDRWYLCVVTTKDPRYASMCEKLLADFDESIALRAWVDRENPKLSWAHFQHRDIGEKNQQDWFAGIKAQLDNHPYPAIILQPPRNGAFGKNSITVGIIHGYDGNPDNTSRLIREKIKGYADVIAGKRLVSASSVNGLQIGHAQTADPVALHPRNPTVWPDLAPPSPKHLSIKRIQELCPGAPASFVREQHKAKVSDEDAVSLDWMAYQEDQAKLKAKTLDQLKPVPTELSPPVVDRHHWQQERKRHGQDHHSS